MRETDFLLHVQASPRAQLSSSTAMERILTRQIAHKFHNLSVIECDLGTTTP